MTEEKIRENRLRRMAGRQGLTISRSRRRDPRAWDYGLWQMFKRTEPGQPGSGTLVLIEEGLTIDQVEERLTK